MDGVTTTCRADKPHTVDVAGREGTNRGSLCISSYASDVASTFLASPSYSSGLMRRQQCDSSEKTAQSFAPDFSARITFCHSHFPGNPAYSRRRFSSLHSVTLSFVSPNEPTPPDDIAPGHS